MIKIKLQINTFLNKGPRDVNSTIVNIGVPEQEYDLRDLSNGAVKRDGALKTIYIQYSL